MDITLKRVFQDYLIKYCHQNTDNQICQFASVLIDLLAPVLIIGIALIGVYLIWVTISSKKGLKIKISVVSFGLFFLFFSLYLYTIETIILYLGLGFLGLALYLQKDNKPEEKKSHEM